MYSFFLISFLYLLLIGNSRCYPLFTVLLSAVAPLVTTTVSITLCCGSFISKYYLIDFQAFAYMPCSINLYMKLLV